MKIANNTFARDEANGDHIIRLHDTDIVIFHDDGTVTLNSGGWRTVTTKRRINQLLPAGWGVVQRGGKWFFNVHSLETGVTQYEAPFFDGMRVALKLAKG